MDFTKRNFSFKTMPFSEFVTRANLASIRSAADSNPKKDSSSASKIGFDDYFISPYERQVLLMLACHYFLCVFATFI